MLNCKWTAALLDSSGYGMASRHYVEALINSQQVDLTLNIATFENERTYHGKIQEAMIPLTGRSLDYKIQVIHLTPENYPIHHEEGKYNIGYAAWETSNLPLQWPSLCNTLDEIWVPSEWNKKVFQNSGVKKPIYVIPHCITVPNIKGLLPLDGDIDPELFVFYSIGQWIERKNFIGLLRAYLTEFKVNEKVGLIIKSYRLGTSPEEQNIIKQDVKNVKLGLNLKHYPQLYFFGNLMTYEQIIQLHLRGDCFVLPHREEGFGVTIAEAMLLVKPVITSAYGGNLDFTNNKNSYLIDCRETPVTNMIFDVYNGHMVWGDPDLMHLRKLMRRVFENQEEAKKKGKKARQDIVKNYNQKTISSIIINRLTEIQNSLG